MPTPSLPPLRFTGRPIALALAAALGLAGCASAPAPATQIALPMRAAPVLPPPNVERVVTGGIYRAESPASTLFTGERRAGLIGDTLKVDIAESLTGSAKQVGNTSRESTLASKGPGTSSNALGGALKSLLNLDASASGSDSYKGSGEGQQSTQFNGRLGVMVVNVLGNGHLVVAGERQLALSNGRVTLRFSGVVDPRDIKTGNVVASADVVDARLEALGDGDTGDSTRRGWLQRALSDALRVW